ncbi:hypothetical protein [Bradyrhizobium sp. TM102]|uniref:hypothetical protein n=1 Tax=Bradyrhizobium sp. TM102 TaxID=2599819 RepID=UPI0012613715|nr:hypothetical protein [Bradyrhizobium sp. TM102]BBO09236.1 hypothetical protein TM102_07060 [Bradyrhizobium sp. TM102]
MSWLQFIDSMVGRLAWPIVVLIVLVAVRKHLGSLAERILELSFGGASVKFEKLLSRGAELIEEAPKQLQSPDVADSERLEEEAARQAKHLTREFAYRSILPAYEAISEELAKVGEELGVKVRNGMSIMRMLWKRRLISSEMVDLFDTLQQARNALAHARELPPTFAVEEYSRQAGYLLSELRIARERLKKDPRDT